MSTARKAAEEYESKVSGDGRGCSNCNYCYTLTELKNAFEAGFAACVEEARKHQYNAAPSGSAFRIIVNMSDLEKLMKEER